MPILGVVASSQAKYQAAYDLIDTFTCTNDATVFLTFSSIPQTYKHLELRMAARGNASIGGGTSLALTFNGDNSANYTYHAMLGAAATSSTNTSRSTSQTVAYCGVVEGNSANAFASTIATIMDYSSTSKVKVVRSTAGQIATGNLGYAFQGSAGWFNGTAAINSIKIDIGGVSALYTGSTFSLYGIKG